ncbi:hypothetical protein GYA93_08980 [Gordonia desulfuricans]|uniref:SRPBCC family protein n=1 Tax=Gordonia desulfuricans TaxID=89051 RepID=A0A7K3LN84_9ACTN|nr:MULTISPECIES: SRPBCC family protein [Gordonia]EMP13719.1 hypothetical protein ISGA_1161 [Gordonia sp. NB41Y]NDK89710.1 hypothetical protein [Gordonia desulfuricans]WLP89714.1 SRPBCC family protein [Gordonia sp. NB41Y]
MLEAGSTVTIAHPVDVVWEYCIQPDHVMHFTPGTIELRSLTDGPVAVGTKWEGTTRILGRTMKWKGEYVRVDADKGSEFRSTESPFRFTITTEVTETSAGTEFSYHVLSEQGLGGIFGKMADPIVVRAYQRSLNASVADIPDLIDDWLTEH